MVHRAEVHTKLVGIMRERLIASLKQLPALAATWSLSGDSPQPSPFSQNLIKQLRTLCVVSPCMTHETSTSSEMGVHRHSRGNLCHPN